MPIFVYVNEIIVNYYYFKYYSFYPRGDYDYSTYDCEYRVR